MSPRSGKGFRTSQTAADLAVTHRHAAGIDVHSREHFVAVAAEDVYRLVAEGPAAETGAAAGEQKIVLPGLRRVIAPSTTSNNWKNSKQKLIKHNNK